MRGALPLFTMYTPRQTPSTPTNCNGVNTSPSRTQLYTTPNTGVRNVNAVTRVAAFRCKSHANATKPKAAEISPRYKIAATARPVNTNERSASKHHDKIAKNGQDAHACQRI